MNAIVFRRLPIKKMRAEKELWEDSVIRKYRITADPKDLKRKGK